MSQVAHCFGAGRGPREPIAMPLAHFIAGPENALAELAAASVTDQWVRFNPLVITGPAGFGKTHLLHCLLQAARNIYPDLRSQWLTGADYARAIAHGIDVDSLADDRNMHRSVDLFIIDGLHEMAAKPLAQQELIHTIDYLVQQDSQVIVASRTPLHEIGSLLPELAGRLTAGLHLPLAPPAAATRGVILTELAKQNDVVVPLPIQERLTTDAHRPGSKPWTVSELAAAIAQLRCFSGQPADGSLSAAAAEIVSHTQTLDQVTAKEINRRVARYFGVTVRDLTGKSRKKTVVRARALAVYLIRKLVGSSFHAIGQSLGSRDHTTVLHAWQRACEWIDSDAGFARAALEVGAAFE